MAKPSAIFFFLTLSSIVTHFNSQKDEEKQGDLLATPLDE